MKKKRFSVEHIVATLKQAEMGLPVANLIRQVGISEQTFTAGRNNTQDLIAISQDSSSSYRKRTND